jgi:hypothetical protein
MDQKRISEEEVGSMLEELYEGEPFKRVAPPSRFDRFFSTDAAADSFLDRLKRLLVIPSTPRRLAFSGAALAVLLLVLLPMIPWQGEGPAVTYREGGAIEATDLPKGRLDAAPGALSWRELAGSASYRVELLDQDGKRLWQADSATTTVDLPADLFAGLPAGSEYRVLVTGLGPDGVVTGTQKSRFIILP